MLTAALIIYFMAHCYDDLFSYLIAHCCSYPKDRASDTSKTGGDNGGVDKPKQLTKSKFKLEDVDPILCRVRDSSAVVE